MIVISFRPTLLSVCSALIILLHICFRGLVLGIVLLENWIEKALSWIFETRAVLQLEYLISFLLIYVQGEVLKVGGYIRAEPLTMYIIKVLVRHREQDSMQSFISFHLSPFHSLLLPSSHRYRSFLPKGTSFINVPQNTRGTFPCQYNNGTFPWT